MKATIVVSVMLSLATMMLLRLLGLTDFEVNFYTFNVFTLILCIVLLTFSMIALFITQEEKRILRQERERMKRGK